jgi:hypothetical protein
VHLVFERRAVTEAIEVGGKSANLVATLNDPKLLDSPWYLTINDRGSKASIFVSNVLSGTVTRLEDHRLAR